MVHRHWDLVLQPLLEALGKGPIVEIGVASGATTARLAELCRRRDLLLHAVDPKPDLDPEELERRFDGHVRFHRERSHEALPRIGPVAAALIDGDHNWHTVHGELTRLRESAAAAGLPFPLTMLHDVEWPYARRDMYYDPDTIPEGSRRQWARRGIAWGEKTLRTDTRGVNTRFANALEEGGPRNGVLTAVEDFVAERPDELELRIVPGYAGLGVLASRELLGSSPALAGEWERLRSPAFLLEQAGRLADEAARATVRWVEASQEASRLRERHEGS